MSNIGEKEIARTLAAARRRRQRFDGNFALIPDEVLTSDAGRTLPHPAVTVLVALAAQFSGHNNGSLTLPRRSITTGQSSAAKYGISNPYTLDRAFHELEARGLALRTRPGSRLPPRAAMFALTWWPINEPLRGDRHDARATLSASNEWASWNASKRERHWTVAENKKRLAEKQRTRQPRDTSASSPGIRAKAKIGSPGIPTRRLNPVAQGYSSDISGVGGARKKQPVGRSPNPRGGDEGASHEARPTEHPLSEDDVRKGLEALLTADASSSERSARSLVTALYTFQDGDLAATIFNETKRLGLRGDAARMFLVEQRDRHKAREKEDLRLDARLAKRMANALSVAVDTFGGGGVSSIRLMLESDGRTREEIWSLFQWAIKEPSLRKQVATPALLRHHWDLLDKMRRPGLQVRPTKLEIRQTLSQGGGRC